MADGWHAEGPWQASGEAPARIQGDPRGPSPEPVSFKVRKILKQSEAAR